MDLIKKDYKEFTQKSWDQILQNIAPRAYTHEYDLVGFYCSFDAVQNLSFMLFNEGEACAIIVLGIYKNNLTFSATPCPIPLISSKYNESTKRKIANEIIKYVVEIASKFSAQDCFFNAHPCAYVSRDVVTSKDTFLFQNFFSEVRIVNRLMFNFSLINDNTETISLASKYHKRNINRSIKKGIKLKVFDASSDKDETKNTFNLMIKAHVNSAGCHTRNIETWEWMLKRIYHNESNLFVAFTENDVPISFLYVGHSFMLKSAWGWTQVNIDEYEKYWMPRHFLEYSAIDFYRKNSFVFYDLGIYSVDSDDRKLSNISSFKQKFGSESYVQINLSKLAKNNIL